MKISDQILTRLQQAVKRAGSAKAFAGICHVSPSNISRYLNRETHTISEDNWEKLAPLLGGNEPQWQPDGIIHSPELADFLKEKVQAAGFSPADIPSLLLLKQEIFTDITEKIRLWPPALLAALLDILNIDRTRLPISENEKSLLPASGIFAAGSAVMRLLPVRELENNESENIPHAAETFCDCNTCFTGRIPVPADLRTDTKAFHIADNRMQPVLQKGDVILTINIPLQDLPDGKIVVAALKNPAGGNNSKLVCRRFFRKSSTHFVLQSNDPAEANLLLDSDAVHWIALAVRRISTL